MDRRIVAEKDGKAFATTAVDVEPGYTIDPSYKLPDPVPTRIGDTGRLKIFELIPEEHGLPEFYGRWDERAGVMDIEISGVSKKTKQLFRNEQSGFSGHHPTPLEGSRRFSVVIRIPGREVFHSVVSFGIEREIAVRDMVAVADLRVDAELIRPQSSGDADE